MAKFGWRRSGPRVAGGPMPPGAGPLRLHPRLLRRSPQPPDAVRAQTWAWRPKERLYATIANVGVLRRWAHRRRHHRCIAHRHSRRIAQRESRHRHRAQAQRSDNPRCFAWATCRRRADTLIIFALICFITSMARSRSAAIFVTRAFSYSGSRSSLTSSARNTPKRFRQM